MATVENLEELLKRESHASHATQSQKLLIQQQANNKLQEQKQKRS